MRAAALRDVHPSCGVSDARSEQSSVARASGGVSSTVRFGLPNGQLVRIADTSACRRVLECPMTREQAGAERHYG